jgi:hypothetical protein
MCIATNPPLREYAAVNNNNRISSLPTWMSAAAAAAAAVGCTDLFLSAHLEKRSF